MSPASPFQHQQQQQQQHGHHSQHPHAQQQIQQQGQQVVAAAAAAAVIPLGPGLEVIQHKGNKPINYFFLFFAMIVNIYIMKG